MMKAHLMGFALFAILIASIGITPVFGQVQEAIVVTTDKASYSEGEKIIVAGEVRDLISGEQITIIVNAPNGNRVFLGQEAIGTDKKFSVEITTGGPLMQVEGDYTITVHYRSGTATTSFEFGGSTPIVPTPPIDVRPSGVTDSTVKIDGTDDLVEYEITGGTLLSIVPNVDDNSLIVSIDATDDGSITLTIPRSVLEATDEGGDTDVIVLVDDEEPADFEMTVTETDRTLTIGFPAGAETIEIIGTWVVPEFGTIAAMILAVAIISIIAISARSRLGIIPRY